MKKILRERKKSWGDEIGRAEQREGDQLRWPGIFLMAKAMPTFSWAWQGHGEIDSELVAERISGKQELEHQAQADAARRAGVQGSEVYSTGQAATLQTGTACEDRARASSVI
ncbi:hypothetical protein [Bremerella volcania]|uniref:hypothetical protein n=1 Tax=Bremerella volcania TaxID=2527984 RepID=UPI0011A7EE05|nr:hypothetical protein [Bremerella volcania]